MTNGRIQVLQKTLVLRKCGMMFISKNGRIKKITETALEDLKIFLGKFDKTDPMALELLDMAKSSDDLHVHGLGTESSG